MKRNRRFWMIAMLFASISITASAQYYYRPRPYNQPRRQYNQPRYQQQYEENNNYLPWSYYKGFLEVGFTGGVGDLKANQLEILTTHGVQLGQNFFVGGGIGVNVLFPQNSYYVSSGVSPRYGNYSSGSDNGVMIPLYFDMRVSGHGRIAPFFDLKMGGAFIASDNLVVGDEAFDNDKACGYFSPTVGVRFALSPKSAVNIGVTYNLLTQRDYYYDYDGYVYDSDGPTLNSLGVRMSLEW